MIGVLGDMQGRVPLFLVLFKHVRSVEGKYLRLMGYL